MSKEVSEWVSRQDFLEIPFDMSRPTEDYGLQWTRLSVLIMAKYIWQCILR
jgi:hypothetical protein